MGIRFRHERMYILIERDGVPVRQPFVFTKEEVDRIEKEGRDNLTFLNLNTNQKRHVRRKR